MAKEDKKLLLKDLCGRLPYGVIVSIGNGKYRVDKKLWAGLFDDDDLWGAKPYLRPMSSMTEGEYNSMSWEGCKHVINYSVKHGFQFVEITSFTIEILNWLNANHFDYCGLIEKGLALEAPEGMYKTE